MLNTHMSLTAWLSIQMTNIANVKKCVPQSGKGCFEFWGKGSFIFTTDIELGAL